MAGSGLLFSACGGLQPQTPSSAHLGTGPIDQGKTLRGNGEIPPPVASIVTLPHPKPVAKVDTYSVSVRNVPVGELLFALSRDAKLNIDLHPGIVGTVTINAIDQTLQQILTRLARQVDMRWEIDGPNLSVMPDTPFLRTYRIDYVNMTRDVKVTTEVSSLVTSASGSGAGSQGGAAFTKIESGARNHFWETLDKNIKDILHETDKILPEGSSETVIERSDQASTTGTGANSTSGKATNPAGLAASPNPASLQQSGSTIVKRTTFREAAAVITNPESGVVTVRATSRQHEKVQEFIDQVVSSAKRQVLIETTIVEVSLDKAYQQGIDWSRFRRDATGFGLTQTSPAITGNLFGLTFSNSGQNPIGFTAAVKLLENYGNVKVLSSPKLTVLNNQTALLKVVKNEVYFTVKADTTTTTSGSTQVYTTTPQSVAVGMVMTVTPQISDSDSVVLNVRPMISTKVAEVTDPNPSLQASPTNPTPVPNKIPVIQTREMESMLRVNNGDITVLGGLMQEQANFTDNGIPGVSAIPGIGEIFTYRTNTATKTELVIFIRPVVLHDASVQGDLRDYASSLPNQKFLQRDWVPRPLDGDTRP